MKTKTIKINGIRELSESALIKAWEELLGMGDCYFWEKENQQSLEASEKLFPISIKSWSDDGRGTGVSWYFTGVKECITTTNELLWSNDGYSIRKITLTRSNRKTWEIYLEDLFTGETIVLDNSTFNQTPESVDCYVKYVTAKDMLSGKPLYQFSEI